MSIQKATGRASALHQLVVNEVGFVDVVPRDVEMLGFVDALIASGVDTYQFGRKGAKTITELLAEVNKGKCRLLKNPQGEIWRRVETVRVRICFCGDAGRRVLVQTHIDEGGRKRRRNRLPSLQCRPDEAPWRTARRLLRERLFLDEYWQDTNLRPDPTQNLRDFDEEVPAYGYPFLKSSYHVTDYAWELCDPSRLFFVLGMPAGNGSVTKVEGGETGNYYHAFWEWWDSANFDVEERRRERLRREVKISDQNVGRLRELRPSQTPSEADLSAHLSLALLAGGRRD